MEDMLLIKQEPIKKLHELYLHPTTIHKNITGRKNFYFPEDIPKKWQEDRKITEETHYHHFIIKIQDF